MSIEDMLIFIILSFALPGILQAVEHYFSKFWAKNLLLCYIGSFIVLCVANAIKTAILTINPTT